MIDVLSALDGIQIPGTIHSLKYRWSQDNAWKATAMRPKRGKKSADDRVQRWPTPQYQHPDDEVQAKRNLASGGAPGCVWLSDPETSA